MALDFAAVKGITLPEGSATALSIGGVEVWAKGGDLPDKLTWEGVIARIAAGIYSTEYALGDIIPLTVPTYGQLDMQVVAFDADNLAVDGKAHMTFLSKYLSTYTYSFGTNYSDWETSSIRSTHCSALRAALPPIISSAILPVQKVSRKNSSATVNTIDDVWIPSLAEMGLSGYETDVPTYASYFVNDNSRKKSPFGGSNGNYWTRSIASTPNVYQIRNTGYIIAQQPSNTVGLAFGFCL